MFDSMTREFARTPRAVGVFVCFSAVVSLTYIALMLLAPAVVAMVVPMTGWSSCGIYLIFCIETIAFILSPSLRSESARSNLKYLVIWAMEGALEFVVFSGHENFGNPFLTISPWRPLWTVALPLWWHFYLSRYGFTPDWLHAGEDALKPAE